MKVKSESEVAESCPTLSDPMDCGQQAPPSMGFSRQEYWSGVPLPSPDSSHYLVENLESVGKLNTPLENSFFPLPSSLYYISHV